MLSAILNRGNCSLYSEPGNYTGSPPEKHMGPVLMAYYSTKADNRI